ncbi:MAG: dehydrogenase [Candidatus Saganbacteria bacterium]|nr:dehydrogenase [Candidatus Saganbacteria bacterium]
MSERPIIIGFGPAGMFAALELIELGYSPLIFERGKSIEERSADIEKFFRERKLDAGSNIQFGEGGAGSYSDGKLFSRKNNSPVASKVLETFVRFGAPDDIIFKSKPHLGTDVLCEIVKNIRKYIISKGGEINFSSKMTGLIVSNARAKGVVINSVKEYLSSKIFLAIGHSARDTFEMLHEQNILIEQRPISVGVRIEHPAELINMIRNNKKAATYSFLYTDKESGRRVYTFCMCPGGEIVNASSENGHLVLNGMSYSKRDLKYSNSAIVVTCKTSDYGSDHPLAGIYFQKKIEQKAFVAGGACWEAPAQNLEDFLRGKMSAALLENSFRMGVRPTQLSDLFPGFVAEHLKKAFLLWKKEYPLFVSDQAILLGAETRTTCPVSFPRNVRCESVNVRNLFPIGEGAGHAGGITSSAIDAIKAVRAADG